MEMLRASVETLLEESSNANRRSIQDCLLNERKTDINLMEIDLIQQHSPKITVHAVSLQDEN